MTTTVTDTNGVTVPFLGAIQASLSVLLTIGYGIAISQFGLLDQSAAKKISRTSVKAFLPMLLIYNVGSQLNGGTYSNYIPILIWSLVYNAISIIIGRIFTKIFRFPRWTIPATTFNNAVSMPLLLIQSLEAAGVLSTLLKSPSDSTSEAVLRVRSYFLVNSIVGNALTFGIGPAQLRGYDEEASDSDDEDENKPSGPPSHIRPYRDEENQEDDSDGEEGPTSPGEEQEQEHVSLLPGPIVSGAHNLHDRIQSGAHGFLHRLPSPLQRVVHAIADFISPPLFGAIIGTVIGIVPPLRRIFFNETTDGGHFNAWLTQSLKNTGELFVTLQVVVVGVKLSRSLRKRKLGEDTGRLNWGPLIFVAAVRYVIWPAISISLIWALAAHTKVLSRDPMLWFALMLMPVGPPSLKISALADVAGADRTQKMVIAKTLAIMYMVSPFMAFGVIGALKACDDAKARLA